MWIVFIVILASILLICFIIGAKSFIEPLQMEINTYRISDNKSGSDTLSVLFFSDYHYPTNRVPLDFLFRSIRSNRPNIVIFGGDMASKPEDREGALFITARIHTYCQDLNIPFVAVLGNHDSALTSADAKSYGYPLLVNEHFNCQTKEGTVWQILGLQDIRLGKADPKAALTTASAFSPKNLADPVPASRRIIIAHNPDSILALDSADGAYCLSGHFHGGQIHLPFHLEFSLLRGEVLCRCGFTEGLHVIHGIRHFISRGYGTVLFPNRLDCKPEIAILSFQEAEAINSDKNDKIIQHYIETNDVKTLT